MTQEPYQVSILVPVYSVEDYIERCARSIFEQTYRNLDIVFVDDCTPDKSIEILRRVLDDYPERKAQTRIIRHEHNRGLSAARNTGMDAAKGDYIYFIDSDDFITADCIETLMAAMQTGDWDMVTADYKEVGPVQTSDMPAKVQLQDSEFRGSDILKTFSVKWHWNAWNKLIDARYVKQNKLRFIENIYFEDVPFTFRMACTANAIKVLGRTTYFYTYRPTSIMHTVDKEKYIQSYLRVVEDMRQTQQMCGVCSYDSEKWIQVFEDKVASLIGLDLHTPPSIKHIQNSEATTTAPSQRNGVAMDDSAACCSTISTGFSPSDSAGGGTVGTAGGDGKDIHIVCSTDTNYIMPTGVMMKSVSMNNYEEKICFHVIVDESVTEDQRKQLERVVGDCSKHKVLFHLVEGERFDDFPQLGITKKYITKATYYRLLFTDLFDDNIHRLLYLDGDMIVTGSLQTLWETELDGYAIGAVTDMSERIHDYHRLGYPASLGYFNAGMLLVNLDYWREHKAKDEFMDIILHHPERIKYHDQDVMNIVFCQCKKMVSFRYNFQDGFMYKPERMEMDADKYAAQIADAISHYTVIHYTSTAKPWHKECLHPLTALWWKYLALTEWKGYRATRRFPYSPWRKAMGDCLRWLHLRPVLQPADYPYADKYRTLS